MANPHEGFFYKKIFNTAPWDHVVLRNDQYVKRKKTWWRHTKDEWAKRYFGLYGGVRYKDKVKMDLVMQMLTDNTLSNDELDVVYLTGQDEIIFRIKSEKHGMPIKGEKIYLCYVKIARADAELIRHNAP